MSGAGRTGGVASGPLAGLKVLEFDQGLLKTGKLGLTACEGVFDDGAPFCAPSEASVPTPLEIRPERRALARWLSPPARSLPEPTQ